MVQKDPFNNVLITQLTDPAAGTATITSSSVDLQGAHGVYISVSFGESGDTLSTTRRYNCKLQDSPDDSVWTDVAAGFVIGAATNAFGNVNGAADDDAVYSLGYSGTERYLRALATLTGTNGNGTPIGIYAITWPRRQATVSNVVTP